MLAWRYKLRHQSQRKAQLDSIISFEGRWGEHIPRNGGLWTARHNVGGQRKVWGNDLSPSSPSPSSCSFSSSSLLVSKRSVRGRELSKLACLLRSRMVTDGGLRTLSLPVLGGRRSTHLKSEELTELWSQWSLE